ncbi:MAG: carbamoyltransferase HypF [archaeon]
MHRYIVRGVIQGVGFRPYIYRKAKENGLVGYVKNIGSGVEIVVNDSEFMKKLTCLPPLAKITEHSSEETQGQFSDFSILGSSGSAGETLLPPDIFMCSDCQGELRDKKNRRHQYYFITCTSCGPRFSMITDHPYDRPFTSMNEFSMCSECEKEYTDPMNRRFHAQTIACNDCGPKLRLINNGRQIAGCGIELIKKSIGIIKSGESIAIKGVGGFHICSLAQDAAVRKVRDILKRPNKPFAIMAKDLHMIRKFALVSGRESVLLKSPQRPIVVLKKKGEIYSEVSELDSIGVMLPYTALHRLLFDYINEPLLMTSCNMPGEPVATDEKIAPAFLTHERRIINRCDDSVVKVIENKSFFLRRSRGYTPLPAKLPVKCADTISLGAEMNNVIAATRKDNCFLSQYIGDTSRLETAEFMRNALNRLVRLTRAKPQMIACDLHPAYNSTAYAAELAEKHNAGLVKIQHHKAHVAGAAAEHGLKDYAGIAMDGLGYGEDGKIWGGEVFDVTDGVDFKRIGSLEEQPQLGGDSAAVHPRKMLFGILSRILDEKEILGLNLFEKKESCLYLKMLDDSFNTPMTTSAGRILDAASALLRLCDRRTYDGRPAMILESAAEKAIHLDPVLEKRDGRTILKTTDLFRFLIDNGDKGRGALAATVQAYLAKGMYEMAASLNKPIVFSGGVAYNRMISGLMIRNSVLVNREIPPGDGGICFGQAYLANLMRMA